MFRESFCHWECSHSRFWLNNFSSFVRILTEGNSFSLTTQDASSGKRLIIVDIEGGHVVDTGSNGTVVTSNSIRSSPTGAADCNGGALDPHHVNQVRANDRVASNSIFQYNNKTCSQALLSLDIYAQWRCFISFIYLFILALWESAIYTGDHSMFASYFFQPYKGRSKNTNAWVSFIKMSLRLLTYENGGNVSC